MKCSFFALALVVLCAAFVSWWALQVALGFGFASPIKDAGTTVSGVISTDTTWTLTNSPYVVTEHVLVDSGVKLTVEAGVMVKFDPGKYLKVKGELWAVGASARRTVFTSSKEDPSPQYDYWGGIFFVKGSSPNSRLEYALVERAGAYERVDFQEYKGAVVIESASPTITRNVIKDNDGAGIIYADYDQAGTIPTITYNLITSSGSRLGTRPNFTFCSDGGLCLRYLGFANVGQNIKYNTIVGNGNGLAVGQTITTSTISQNNIFRNTPYDLALGLSRADQNWANNYLGTTDSAVIASRIWDFYDDLDVPKILYSPPLTSPNIEAPLSPPAGIAASVTALKATLSWSPNPESDLAGYTVYRKAVGATVYTKLNTSPLTVPSYIDTLAGSGTYTYTVTALDSTSDESWYSEPVVLDVDPTGAGPTPTPTATPTPTPAPVPGTQVKGVLSSDTIWTRANSPYVVTEHVLVDSGVKLTVEAGVMVKFDPGKYLKVKGTLWAVGTPASRITFTSSKEDPSPQYDYWGGIFFVKGSSPNSRLEYALLERAGAYERVDFQEYKGAVVIDSASPTITRNVIKDNDGAGVIYGDNDQLGTTPTITHNLITTSGASLSGPPNFVMCSDGGLCLRKLAFGNVGQNIKYNTIVGNGNGLVVGQAITTTTISQNNIFRNTPYDLALDVSIADQNWANNYLGATDTGVIAGRIWDFYDDLDVPKILYSPPLASPNIEAPLSPPAGIAASVTALKATLSWSPNPESNLAGYTVYRKAVGATVYTKLNTSPLTVPSYIDTLAGSGTYTYTVTALDSTSEESWYSQPLGVTIERPPPTPSPTPISAYFPVLIMGSGGEYVSPGGGNAGWSPPPQPSFPLGGNAVSASGRDLIPLGMLPGYGGRGGLWP